MEQNRTAVEKGIFIVSSLAFALGSIAAGAEGLAHADLHVVGYEQAEKPEPKNGRPIHERRKQPERHDKFRPKFR